MSEQGDFLRALWPDGLPARARLLLWTLQDKRSRWHAQIDRAVLMAEQLPPDHDCYVGCALAGQGDDVPERGAQVRATADETVALPGFWADIDIEGSGHAGRKRRPKDLGAARRLVESFAGQPPSLLIASGHGLQAWWLFKEPMEFWTEPERALAAAKLRAWGEACAQKARQAGYDIDAVFDLARVMRVPGTMNCKVPGQQVPVKML